MKSFNVAAALAAWPAAAGGTAAVQREPCSSPRSYRAARRLTLVVLLAVMGISDLGYAQSTPPAASAPRFISINDNALLVSRLLGTPVRNASGEVVGTIQEMALEGGELTGVVLSVAAAPRATGQRYVAVDPSSISIEYAESKWTATLNATVEQLLAAPEFHYADKWQR